MPYIESDLALNFDTYRFGSLGSHVITSASGSAVTSEGDGFKDEIWGTFSDAGGGQYAGSVAGYSQYAGSSTVLKIIGLADFSVADFAQAVSQNLSLSELLVSLGNIQVRGTAFGDLIRTHNGGDRIYSGFGNDTVFAGAGNDLIDEGYGKGGGQNYLRGEDGNDTIIGGDNFDDLHGNAGDDNIEGGHGDDWVVGGKGDDRLQGQHGDDIVYGNLGNDTCYGDWAYYGGPVIGRDLIRGGKGDDSLIGGWGDDWLSGDRDSDTISGGAGADVFHTFGEAGLDMVLDFNRAEGDRVQLAPGTAYTLAQAGSDVHINMVGGGQMVLVGVDLANLTGEWIFTL